MVVRIVAVLSLLVGTVAAQNAEFNLWVDDEGEVFFNGAFVSNDTMAFGATISDGENCMALKAINGGWGGGLYFSTVWEASDGPDTLVSDDQWTCTYKPQLDDAWKSVGFDDSGWWTAGDYGLCADDTGGDPTRHFLNKGVEMANLFYHGAHLIWTPRTCYFRKNFTTTSTTGQVMIRGNGFSYALYMNGTEVTSSSSLNRMDDPLVQISGVTLNNGDNTFAAAITDAIYESNPDEGYYRGDGVLCKMAFSAGAQIFRSDQTWLSTCDESLPGNWNTVGYDDSDWEPTGTPTGYDGTTDALTPASWVWPTDIYFRQEFDAGEVGVIKINRIDRDAYVNTSAPAYFNLRGQMVPQTISVVKGNNMVVKQVKGGAAERLLDIQK